MVLGGDCIRDATIPPNKIGYSMAVCWTLLCPTDCCVSPIKYSHSTLHYSTPQDSTIQHSTILHNPPPQRVYVQFCSVCPKIVLLPKTDNIFDKLSPEMEKLGLESKCLGGGKIEHNSKEKKIRVFGISTVSNS